MKFSKPRLLRSKKYRTVRKPRVVRSVPLKVKQYVKKAIALKAENKSTVVTFNNTFGSILESPDMGMYPILWYTGYHTLAQGVLDGNRIGNRVNIRKVMLRYVLNPQEYSATFNPNPLPTHIQLFLGRVKQSKSVLPSTTEIGRLFNAGSIAYGPAGNLSDLNAIINDDYWDIKKKWTHKLAFAEYAGTGSVPGQNYFANNDFKLNHVRTLDITRYVQKMVTFDDSNATVQNGNLFFFYQAIAANGGSTGASIVNSRINFSIEIQYEDS